MNGTVRCRDCASFPGRFQICPKIGKAVGRGGACSFFALRAPAPVAILAPDVRTQGKGATDPAGGPLAALVAALGPLVSHVQHLGPAGTGFAVRLHLDTPMAAAAAIYAECGRFAGLLRAQAQATKPTPKARKPRSGRASR